MKGPPLAKPTTLIPLEILFYWTYTPPDLYPLVRETSQRVKKNCPLGFYYWLEIFMTCSPKMEKRLDLRGVTRCIFNELYYDS